MSIKKVLSLLIAMMMFLSVIPVNSLNADTEEPAPVVFAGEGGPAPEGEYIEVIFQAGDNAKLEITKGENKGKYNTVKYFIRNLTTDNTEELYQSIEKPIVIPNEGYRFVSTSFNGYDKNTNEPLQSVLDTGSTTKATIKAVVEEDPNYVKEIVKVIPYYNDEPAEEGHTIIKFNAEFEKHILN